MTDTLLCSLYYLIIMQDEVSFPAKHSLLRETWGLAGGSISIMACGFPSVLKRQWHRTAAEGQTETATGQMKAWKALKRRMWVMGEHHLCHLQIRLQNLLGQGKQWSHEQLLPDRCRNSGDVLLGRSSGAASQP